MQLVRPRGLSALLTVALSAGVLAGAGTLASPASAEGAAPTGAYALNTAAIWEAQSVLLTQTALADDVDAADKITRMIKWGDGTEEELKTGTNKLRHPYAKAGTYTVSVELTDSEDNTAKAEITGTADVKVTVTPGTYKVKIGSPWVGPYGSTVSTISLAGVPANVSRVKIYWGEGDAYSTVKRTATTANWYYSKARTAKVTVALETADGESAQKAVGTIVGRADGSPPKTAVTTPKNAYKASTWKSVSGTSVDKGAGADGVRIFLIQQRGSQLYYYAFKSAKWIKIKPDTNIPADGYVNLKVAKNAWKVNVKGVTKGWLDVYYLGWDKVGNGPDDFSYKSFTITK
jgi:5'-nucleotidase